MYLIDNGTPPEGGRGETPETPTAFEMPEKFQGKSAEDIAKAYSDLETQYGKASAGTAQYSKLEQQLAEHGEILKKIAEVKEEKPVDDETIKLQKEYYKNTLGLVGADELDAKIKEAQQAAIQQVSFDTKVKSLESKYDGSDGRPKFDSVKVGQYALEKGLTSADPETVYEHMNSKEIIDWHVKQAITKQPAPSPGAGKGANPPTAKSITDFKTADERERYMEEKARALLS